MRSTSKLRFTSCHGGSHRSGALSDRQLLSVKKGSLKPAPGILNRPKERLSTPTFSAQARMHAAAASKTSWESWFLSRLSLISCPAPVLFRRSLVTGAAANDFSSDSPRFLAALDDPTGRTSEFHASCIDFLKVCSEKAMAWTKLDVLMLVL